MSRTLLQRLHNPHNRTCGCDPDCWCRRTAIGRLVKWWFPARYFGLRHKNRWIENTFKGWTDDEIRAWKQRQAGRPEISEIATQPRYEKIVRLAPMRYGLTVRRDDGTVAVHELARRADLRFGS